MEAERGRRGGWLLRGEMQEYPSLETNESEKHLTEKIPGGRAGIEGEN